MRRTWVSIPGARTRPAGFEPSRSGVIAPTFGAISVEEVTRGLHPGEDAAFESLLQGLFAAPIGIPEGRLAGYWWRSLARRGRTISQADALVAAAAVGMGGRLATGNPKDFPVRGLEVEHWPV